MPRKRKDSKKSQKPSTPDSSWLSKFCRSNDIPEEVSDVLAQNQITSTSYFASITEQDLTEMGFVVGQKILLRRIISRLQQDNNEDPKASKPLSSEAPDPLPGFDLEQELSNIEAALSSSSPTKDNAKENDVAKPTAASSSGTTDATTPPEGKPLLPSDFIYGADGKQLKPLQLSYTQFVLANIKILESLFTKSPREAEEYLTYLKFLAIKGTRFQTKAILAFDQDYRATKARENYSWGSNLHDLSAQYFDAAVAQRPSRASDNRGESLVSSGEEFCFCWNFNPNGCPSPQSCRHKHACIHCSSDKHKGKSCTGAASPVAGKK